MSSIAINPCGCGGKAYRSLWKSDADYRVYDMVTCQKCGFEIKAPHTGDYNAVLSWNLVTPPTPDNAQNGESK